MDIEGGKLNTGSKKFINLLMLTALILIEICHDVDKRAVDVQ